MFSIMEFIDATYHRKEKCSLVLHILQRWLHYSLFHMYLYIATYERLEMHWMIFWNCILILVDPLLVGLCISVACCLFTNSLPFFPMQPATSSNLPLAWNGWEGVGKCNSCTYSVTFLKGQCDASLTVTSVHWIWLVEKKTVYLPSKPFHCEAGSGLILPLAAAVWKTSDFVVFS